MHWNNRGKKSVVWQCVGRLEEKGSDCASPTMLESDLQEGIRRAVNQVISGRDMFIGILMKNIATVLGEEFDKDATEIDRQLEETQHAIIREATNGENYDALAEKIYQLREAKQDTLEHNAERQAKRQRIADMTAFLQEQGGEITEYDDKLVRQLVERVEVLPEKLTVTFKSDIETEIEL